MKRTLQAIQHFIALLIIELPARAAGLDRLITRLEKNGQALEKRFLKTNDRPANQQILTHMIGIERWGQRRLRVALGEALVPEEYDHYRPEQQDWRKLQETFLSVRQETVSLGKSLRMAGVDPNTSIHHNQFGEISLLGWFYYLNLHASIESFQIH
jgi:hypothetical protein